MFRRNSSTDLCESVCAVAHHGNVCNGKVGKAFQYPSTSRDSNKKIIHKKYVFCHSTQIIDHQPVQK